MSKEGEFFIYLLERYADFKKQKASDILKLWDEADLTKLIYDLYEIYHVERLENAFEDIDILLKERSDLVEAIIELNLCFDIFNSHIICKFH